MASLDEQTFAAVVAKTTSTEEYLEGVAALEPWLVPDVIDMLVAKISAFGKEREPALTILTRLDPAIVRRKLPDILQPVINMCTDTSKKVRELSLDALEKLVRMNGNADLDAVIPALVNALKDQAQTNQAIEDLASCIFVQDVEAPALAVMLPIIKRGLRAKITEVQRKTCVILSNVCRLVDDPKELSLAVPEILPMVKNCAENISKPEARAVAERAVQTILEHYDPNLVLRKWSAEEVHAIIAKFGEPTDLMVQCVKNLCTACHFDTADWERVFAGNKDLCNKVLRECQGMAQPSAVFFEDTEEGQDLYKGEFSLAYGTLTLLRKTRLHLKRNRFYGLLGPNNCGKTTLMRAIDNEQIEGFPKKTELRTLFVEHEIAEREVGEDEHHYPIFNTDLSGTDWIVDYCNNVCGLEPKITREQAGDTMKAIGFGKERAADPDMPVTTYSGGWKVKMQLCAATLMNADILMLDEPTGHLDVANIQWLKDWLRSFLRGGGSIITTSHDTQFLEEMCTHIIDFQKKKLLMFKGNLKEFVDKYPEKKSYFTLTAEKVKFKFPEPGPLEGVKSLSKSILKMTGVTFQYPTRDKPTVFDICLEVSRVSRVAVIGPNGAGKSTAIKLLIGELTPSSGAITKHPNMRLAYVAQHAFHHLEKHLNLTPAQYIMWRFAGNEDKESVELLNKKVDKDEKEITKYWIKDGTTLVQCYNPGEDKKAVEPEMILARHENKKDKTKEYEVKWRNKPTDCNLWVRREILISMGAEKMVQKFDEKMAAESGLQFKPLTTSGVEKHLADFGIDAETASHTLIRSLSGGQKIKVVLAASTWQNPHIIVLDEPTNYLDRDSLGALTQAIHDYKGGVIIISHNREFAGAVCQEKWIMDAGRLRREGESIAMHEEEQVVELGEQTVIDAMGNEIKVNKQTAMTAKEKKQEIKKIQKMISEGKKKKTRSEDEIADLEYRLAELQAMP